jgi:hypothetical protein
VTEEAPAPRQIELEADDVALERVCIQRAQQEVEAIRQNLSGIEMLGRIETRLQDEIRDVRAAIETVAQLRRALRGKNVEDFQKAINLVEVVARI